MAYSLDRLRGFLTRLFFANFFRLLLLVISVAEWVVATWIALILMDLRLPVWFHVAGALAVYGFNRLIVGHRPLKVSPAASLARKTYSAFAFVCLLCFVFMLLSGGLWYLLRTVVAVVATEAVASGYPAVIGKTVDSAFHWFISMGMGAISALLLYGYGVGSRQLRVVPVTVRLRGLPPGLVGLRIAQISDIHVGQNLTAVELQGFVDAVNRLAPDLVCITGDIADSPLADLDGFFPILAGLRARYGVCAVLGNHDHYAGADRVSAALARWTPFRLLRDSALTLEVGAAHLHVIGLDDRGRDWARGVTDDEVLAGLAATAPESVVRLLLVHRPDVFPQAASAGVGLTLSGHTHGGQLAFPWRNGRFRNLAEFITRFDRGLFAQNGGYLYVNCGLGVTGQPIRLFTPREITVIELQVDHCV